MSVLIAKQQVNSVLRSVVKVAHICHGRVNFLEVLRASTVVVRLTFLIDVLVRWIIVHVCWLVVNVTSKVGLVCTRHLLNVL